LRNSTKRGDREEMKVLVTGSTGLIGSALVRDLAGEGHIVTRLLRSSSGTKEDAVLWNPEKGTVDCNGLTGHDAVVHLAGENIAGSSWTPKRKALIRDSRVKGTVLLCESLSRLARPPGTLVCASAVGYYGDRGNEMLKEDSPPGKGFLAEICREWEEATGEIARTGVRVVNLRIGMVLSAEGGALAKMLPAFRAGAGVIRHALATNSLEGPVNAVAPHPVTNREFTKLLGRILWRPTIAAMPAFAARLLFGEMADELLLASTRVAPAELIASEYRFRFPEAEGALRYLLGR
jgi:NAD dependent epimerase/dehydratase family enzyme